MTFQNQFENEQFVHWWSSLIDKQYIKDDGSFEILPVSQMIFIFINLSPVLILMYDSKIDDKAFWSRFHRLVSSMLKNENVPEPTKSFSDFISCFYRIRDHLDFSTPEDIVSLISIIPEASTPSFMLWKLPEKIDDPFLYFQTLFFMHQNNISVWNSFISKMGSVDLLFDKYMPFLEPSKSSNQFMVMVINFLINILEDKHRSLASFYDTTDKLYSCFMNLLQSSDMNVSAAAFRGSCFLFHFSRSRQTIEHHSSWLFDLIKSTEYPSPFHTLAYEFVFKVKLSNFKYFNLCNFIITKGISEISDFMLLKKILLNPHVDKPLPIIQHLFNIAINHKIWGRAAATTLTEIVSKFSDQQSLISWITPFIRRCFIFIGYSRSKGKYFGKINSILYLFERLMETKIDWINRMSSRYYSSLVNSKRLEHISKTINIDSIIDSKFLNEIDTSVTKRVNMKTYLSLIEINDEPSQQYSPISMRHRSNSNKVTPTIRSRKKLTKPFNGRPMTKKNNNKKGKSSISLSKSSRLSSTNKL